MRVLYIYCHPLPESFHAAIRAEALAGLKEAGHTVDLCDLYAEKFDPVMCDEERRDYHDLSKNQSRVADYVRRLREADALIFQFPVWSFGPPAMLKGWMDRLLMPGVAFDLSNPNMAMPLLTNLKRIAGDHHLRPAVVERVAGRQPAEEDHDALHAALHQGRESRLLSALSHERRDARKRARRSSPRCAPRWYRF